MLAADASPSDLYHPVAPVRLLDTRAGLGAPAARLGPASFLRLQVSAGEASLATGVTAVALNVTATEPTRTSFLTAWPGSEAQPLASTPNFTAGKTVPNLVMVKVGPAGTVNLYNNAGSVHMIADVAGWYGTGAGSVHSPNGPARILDTRYGLRAPAAKLAPRTSMDVQITGRGGVPQVASTGPRAGACPRSKR